jgi:hypothetical protein
MEELDDEILEIEDVFKVPKKKHKANREHPKLQGTSRSDFRIYSARVSSIYSLFYSDRRDFLFKKQKLFKH